MALSPSRVLLLHHKVTCLVLAKHHKIVVRGVEGRHSLKSVRPGAVLRDKLVVHVLRQILHDIHNLILRQVFQDIEDSMLVEDFLA